MNKKTKVLMGVVLVLSALTTIVASYADTYDYYLSEPKVLADYTVILISTEGKFDARDVISLSVIVSYIIDDPIPRYVEELITPTRTLLAPRIILLTSDGWYPPDGCYLVEVTVDGSLESGEIFVSSGPGPGFRRRP